MEISYFILEVFILLIGTFCANLHLNILTTFSVLLNYMVIHTKNLLTPKIIFSVFINKEVTNVSL